MTVIIMPYKYIVVWFNPAKHWIGYAGKDPKEKAKYPRPLEVNAKPFRSLPSARKFQRLWCKPYPHIYQIRVEE